MKHQAVIDRDKPSLYKQLLNDFANQLEQTEAEKTGLVKEAAPDVVDWLEEHFYVDRPRAPITGDILSPGPIQLAEYQKRILREAFSRNENGLLRYSTIVWSEPKKSGKTAIGAGVGLYTTAINDAIYSYCMANDGKQSADRIYHAIARCVVLHSKLGGIFRKYRANISRPILRLDNGSAIEALPCDAAGEAGAEPMMTVWSELWGYAQKHKERMWTEMTIPPTLFGYAMRWVESYAGYEGESMTLWQLYQEGVENAYPHPDFPDLPVYVNETARQLTFWSHQPRQPWQTQAYYEQEAKALTPNEFKRIHTNHWVTSTTAAFDDMILWDRCKDDLCVLPSEGDFTVPMVIAIDAAYAEDTAAIYVVSRHPDDEWDEEHRRVIKRYSIAYKPMPGKKLDFSKTIEPKVKWLVENYNIYSVVYDPYQLHKMCTDLRIQGDAPYKEFSQAGRRLRADKQIYDMIIHRTFFHDGDPTDRYHVANTAKQETGQHMRFVKNVAGKPIDLLVAASMATDECLSLNL